VVLYNNCLVVAQGCRGLAFGLTSRKATFIQNPSGAGTYLSFFKPAGNFPCRASPAPIGIIDTKPDVVFTAALNLLSLQY